MPSFARIRDSRVVTGKKPIEPASLLAAFCSPRLFPFYGEQARRLNGVFHHHQNA
jgi:hypothetical protein